MTSDYHNLRPADPRGWSAGARTPRSESRNLPVNAASKRLRLDRALPVHWPHLKTDHNFRRRLGTRWQHFFRRHAQNLLIGVALGRVSLFVSINEIAVLFLRCPPASNSSRIPMCSTPLRIGRRHDDPTRTSNPWFSSPNLEPLSFELWINNSIGQANVCSESECEQCECLNSWVLFGSA